MPPLDRFVAYILAGFLAWLPTQDFLSGLVSLPSSQVLSFFCVSFVVFDFVFRVCLILKEGQWFIP